MKTSILPKRTTILHVRSKDALVNDLNTNINMILKNPVLTNNQEVCIIGRPFTGVAKNRKLISFVLINE